MTQSSGRPTTPKVRRRRSIRIQWSTVSNVALRSSRRSSVMAGVSSDVRITEDFEHRSLCGVVPTVSRLLLRYQTGLLQVLIELFVCTAFKQL